MFESVSPLLDFYAPDGPSTPFAQAVLLFDIMRVLVVAMGLYIAFVSVMLILERANTLGMKARLAGTCMAYFFFIAGTEIAHFGDYAHWRLFLGFIAAVVYSWGLWSFYKWESPPTLRAARGV